MAGTPTTVYQFATLDGGDNNDSVAAVNALAAALDALLLPRTVTTAQRNALSGGRRPIGLIISNSTSNRLERWNGSAWEALDVVAQATANAALPKAGGTMSGAIAMGGSKVTGLAAATANGDAVRYEQLAAAQAAATARVVSGVTTISSAMTKSLTLTPPAGTTLSVVVAQVSATTADWLRSNGYSAVTAVADVDVAATGVCHIDLRRVAEVGAAGAADPTGPDKYVSYVAHFA